MMNLNKYIWFMMMATWLHSNYLYPNHIWPNINALLFGTALLYIRMPRKMIIFDRSVQFSYQLVGTSQF